MISFIFWKDWEDLKRFGWIWDWGEVLGLEYGVSERVFVSVMLRVCIVLFKICVEILLL